jgi:hypothetical protein
MSNKEITVEELREAIDYFYDNLVSDQEDLDPRINKAINNNLDKLFETKTPQDKIKEMNEAGWVVMSVYLPNTQVFVEIYSHTAKYDEDIEKTLPTFNEAIDWAYEKYLECKEK